MDKDACDVRVDRHVQIPMRDGVRLSAHLTRPVADGPFPAVIEYSPYRKGVYSDPPARFRRLAERGYVVVQYDVRGTGDSEGFTTDVYQDPERQDGYDVVEWVAAQPWCDGNVGMWGISYCGVVCWQVAAQAPPHLKAIIVRSGTDDVYTEWTNPGGLPRPYMYENYAPLMTAYNLAPPSRELVGERWAEMWQERLDRSVPWGIGFIEHLTDGPYWRARSVRPDYERVKCAVFVIGGWADWYYHPLLRAFAALNVPKRALIGPWSHMWPEDAVPGPRIDGLAECLRFFDRWLKGIDTGIADEPPVTLFVREYRRPSVVYTEDVGSFQYEDNWPPARAQAMRLHLGDGDLVAEASAAEDAADELEYDPAVGVAAGKHGGGAFPPWGMSLDQRIDEARSLCYTSRALRQDLEVIGVPRAVLHVQATARVVGLVVKLCDVAPDGTSSLVTKGYLNAAHRDGHQEPEPLVPGQRYELELELLACAYRFAAGHRIRLDVACADFQNAWPTPERCTLTVLRGQSAPSHLVLPVAPLRDAQLPPNLAPSPYPLPALDELPRPEYSVTTDLAADTVTLRYVTGSGAGTNRSQFTVSRADPAQALVDSRYRMEIDELGEQIVIETQTLTASDALAFHHQVEAEITVNGRQHFRKSWRTSVPRGLT